MVVIEPQVHRDGRGFFAETYRAERLAELGIREEWVQDNHSRSARGVLRGMHFSVGEGQAKLVRCARGAILDVAVDIRRGSPTYGRWDAVRLDDVALRAVYLPVGFAHGFVVVSDVADVVYKCSALLRRGARARLRLGRPRRGHPLARRRRRGLRARRLGPAAARDRRRAARSATRPSRSSTSSQSLR